MLEPAYRHVFVIPVSGGTPRQLTSGDYQHRGPLAWSPDNTKPRFLQIEIVNGNTAPPSLIFTKLISKQLN